MLQNKTLPQNQKRAVKLSGRLLSTGQGPGFSPWPPDKIGCIPIIPALDSSGGRRIREEEVKVLKLIIRTY